MRFVSGAGRALCLELRDRRSFRRGPRRARRRALRTKSGRQVKAVRLRALHEQNLCQHPADKPSCAEWQFSHPPPAPALTIVSSSVQFHPTHIFGKDNTPVGQNRACASTSTSGAKRLVPGLKYSTIPAICLRSQALQLSPWPITAIETYHLCMRLHTVPISHIHPASIGAAGARQRETVEATTWGRFG